MMVRGCELSASNRRFNVRRFSKRFNLALFALLVFSAASYSQVDTATVSGVITDQSGAVVVSAEVRVTNTDTNIIWTGTSNRSGVYLVTGLKPGRYRIHIGKEGFKGIDLTDLTLNVQDSVSRNFMLQVGSTSESISVEGNELQINTQDASVGTIVDRQFAENLPLNGRSFQTLIQLTPGVVLNAPSLFDGGQFTVDGQRGTSNYWMVDGVSANFGINAAGVFPGNGSAGTLPSFSVLGGTNSLVSVDAMQEFRIQTSTYAPEFGRTPGGQISIVTRSGSNQLHGAAFDYLRNDVLDASNWFNGYNNNPPLPKAEERQNDFGGTFSGPIVKDRTFFFFSYEGLRLRLPETTLTTVPDLTARENATPALQPYLNAYPFDAKQPDLGNGIAQFNASYSNPASLDAYSLRVDHRFSDRVLIFGRYNYSPSELKQRGIGNALNDVTSVASTTQTATIGATWLVSPTLSEDFRFNYSRTNGRSSGYLDDFGSAVPLTPLPFPTPFTNDNATFIFRIGSLLDGSLNTGRVSRDLQRQINITDNVSAQRGSHSLKFGVDFRRLSPVHDPYQYYQEAFFGAVADAASSNLSFALLQSARTSELLFHNLGIFAQDTWRVARRLTVTYGLRWDVDFAPSSASGPSLLAVTGYSLNGFSNLALAPSGTPPFKTTYGNLAPRVGAAYQVSQSQSWQTVLRAGFGVFYDLATAEVGNANSTGSSYPFGGQSFLLGPGFGGTTAFPLSPTDAAPPAITVASLSPGYPAGSSPLYAFDPNLKLPYTLEWNISLQQSLGTQQTISLSYIGSVGRRLIQTAVIVSPNSNFAQAELVGNTGTSNYNALQIQFQRRLSRGVQALASYSLSHSIDTGSTGSFDNASNTFAPGSANQNRGPSDFDIRNAFSAGLTYEIPSPKTGAVTKAILGGWSLDSIVQARSAPPVDIYYTTNTFADTLVNGGVVNIRPDVVPGQPLYLYGPQYPGAKAINPGAFAPPPADANGNPLHQGNLGRNTLRGFGASQWDFAVHRDFLIHESLKLQFRAEMFNILNHPNFGPPMPAIDQGGFGIATQTLGQSLSGGLLGAGGFSPLYQVGGPRSCQFALKLSF
jgi:hypothetical protein